MDERMDEVQGMTGGEEQNFGISSDLIRGHINTIILRSLYDGDKYGYEIIDEIEKKSGGLYTIKQPTLYSALKRLESLQYVTSYYGDQSYGGRRKYFSLTDSGKQLTEQNLSDWEYSRTIIDSLISDGNAHYDFSFITDKQNELVELKRALAAREQAIEDEKKALASLRNELQRERALLSTQSSSLSVQKDDFKELKEKVDEQTRELEEKSRALAEKEGEIIAKELALAEKEREIEGAKSELERQNAEISELKLRLEAQQAAFQDKENEIAFLREENAKLEELSKNATNSEELEGAKAELSAIKAELDEKKNVIAALNSAVATQENTISILKSDYESKSTEFYNRGLELRAGQAQLDAQKERLESDKRALEEKEAELIARENALQESINNAKLTEESASTTREELKNQLETLEVERSTLRTENEALEAQKAELQREREELNGMREALQAERTEIDRQTYDVTQREYALQEARRTMDDKEIKTNASTEEIERLREDLQAREMELLRGNHKLQEDLATLEQHQKEFSSRQKIYNQQQLDFITRKNALNAQQFDFADKLSSYNAQVKLFNENLEKFEGERAALRLEEQKLEERARALSLEKTELEEKKAKFEQEKEETEKLQKDMQARAADEAASYQRQLGDLRERELELSRRENDLNAAAREFRSQQYAAYSANNEYAYGYAQRQPMGYDYYNAPPTQPENRTEANFNDLRERAQSEGIKLNTAGNMGRINLSATPATERQTTNSVGCYNVGLTLFKSAFIIFCIIAFESLVAFFIKDYIGVSAVYPAVGFALGFITFIVCAITYACGYRPRARRRKHPSYILTAAVVFVITVIIVTMVAVYCKAQISDPAQLLSFVVIPVIYLLNILFFVAFYYLFSVRASKN